MRFVAVKSVAQQDLLALHRVRAQLIKQRIALTNQMRALLHERGVAAPLGAAALRRTLVQALADESNEVTGELGDLMIEMGGWLREFESRIAALGERIERGSKNDERCRRLRQFRAWGRRLPAHWSRWSAMHASSRADAS